MYKSITYVILMAAVHSVIGQLNLRQRQDSAIFEHQFLRPKQSYYGIKRYDNRIKPNDAIAVQVSMAITSISPINAQSDFRVQLILQQNWTDERLSYRESLKYITLTDVYRIWKPDLHFLNEIYGSYHYIINPNTFARLYPNGQVLYNIRLTLFFKCKIDYKRIPFDRFHCAIPLTSYDSKENDDVTVTWSETEPVHISQQLKVPLFKLEKYNPGYCNPANYEGNQSCIELKLTFKREIHVYMTRYFIPFMTLVMMSWLPFWIPHDATHIRLSVPILTIWVARDLAFGHNFDKNAPNNTLALDIWMAFCFFLLIAAFLQYVLLIFLLHRQQENTSHSENTTSETNNEGNLKITGRKCERIDGICRFLFPIVFLVFNLLYWSVYMGKKNNKI